MNGEKLFEEWAESGLEFENRIEKIFEKNKWTVHHEYDYEVYRRLPEMGDYKKEFVTRSIDLAPVKSELYKEKYTIFHQGMIEVKYFKGKMCFLSGNKLLKNNTKNMAIYEYDPRLLRPSNKICSLTLEDTPLLYKGTSIPKKPKNLIINTINQILFASTHLYSHLYFLHYPKKNIQSTFYEIYIIHPIIVTNAELYVRNDEEHNTDNEKDFNTYFDQIECGIILIPYKIYFNKYQKNIFDECYSDNIKFNYVDPYEEVFNRFRQMNTPTRCYIVNMDYLTEFLNKLYEEFTNLGKEVLDSYLIKKSTKTLSKKPLKSTSQPSPFQQ